MHFNIVVDNQMILAVLTTLVALSTVANNVISLLNGRKASAISLKVDHLHECLEAGHQDLKEVIVAKAATSDALTVSEGNRHNGGA